MTEKSQIESIKYMIKKMRNIYDGDVYTDNDNEIKQILDTNYPILPQSEKDKWKRVFYCILNVEHSYYNNEHKSIQKSVFDKYLKQIDISIQERKKFLSVFKKKVNHTNVESDENENVDSDELKITILYILFNEIV